MVKDLRKRAIDVAKAELDDKADLTFTYTPIKVGKRITGWKFRVEGQPPPAGATPVAVAGGRTGT